MRPDETAGIHEPRATDGLTMLEAMKLGVDQALRDHQTQGVPIITWDADAKRIVEVPADQIPAWIEAANPRGRCKSIRLCFQHLTIDTARRLNLR